MRVSYSIIDWECSVFTAIVTDYRFLEEVGCYVDSIDRDSLVRSRQKKNYGLNVRLIMSNVS